jgi:hypothetical protein
LEIAQQNWWKITENLLSHFGFGCYKWIEICRVQIMVILIYNTFTMLCSYKLELAFTSRQTHCDFVRWILGWIVMILNWWSPISKVNWIKWIYLGPSDHKSCVQIIYHTAVHSCSDVAITSQVTSNSNTDIIKLNVSLKNCGAK